MSVSLNAPYSLPSKEQAQRTFWGLGNEFWKQIIDGKFHECGPNVFDQGLHYGTVEEGFFRSLKSGCEFASQHLTEKPTVQFYKNLHRKLCAHFKGEKNNTQMQAHRAGIFRESTVYSQFSIKEFSEEARQCYFFAEIYQSSLSENHGLSEIAKDREYRILCNEWFEKSISGYRMNLLWLEKWKSQWEAKENISQEIDRNYSMSKKWVERWESKWDEKVINLNKYIVESCFSMGVDCLVSLSKIDSRLIIDYGTGFSQFEELEFQMSDNRAKISEKIEKAVRVLFDRYNQKIDAIHENPPEEHIKRKVEAISELYQWLEWFHPFTDGQGRCDLVFQAMQLSAQGSNPAILEDPYLSSYSYPSESTEYLLSGIEDWAREQKVYRK